MKKLCLIFLIAVATQQSSFAQWTTSGTNIYNSNSGNVGIGNTSPAAKLNVTGSEAIRLTGTGTTGIASVGYLSFYDSNNTQRYGFLGDASNSSSDLYFSADIGGLNFGTGGANGRMYINSTGNVSIGTTDGKGYMLAVNGTAIATSMTVKLNANWPDYVFKTGYRLPSLSETSAYILQYGHLPDLPSAQQVADKGLDLGEANKLLTKKIEELTLYLIGQDKVEIQQQEKITSLEVRLARLEKAITKMSTTRK